MMAGFMILGAILSMGKCSFLIAGYNMMNRGQKKQYDEQALCRFMGKIMYCLAFAMLLWLASIIFQNSVLLSASPVLSGGKHCICGHLRRRRKPVQK